MLGVNMIKAEFDTKALERKLKPARLNKIFKENLVKMGAQWHLEDMPNKFKDSAINVYKLQQRSFKYIKSVKRKYGDWSPFNKTGMMKEATKLGVNIKANTKGNNLQASVKMQRGHATSQWVAIEFVKVLKREIEDLLKDFKQRVIYEIEKA